MGSDPQCGYTWPTDGSCLNQIGGHVDSTGCSHILTIGIHGLQVNFVLIKLLQLLSF